MVTMGSCPEEETILTVTIDGDGRCDNSNNCMNKICHHNKKEKKKEERRHMKRISAAFLALFIFACGHDNYKPPPPSPPDPLLIRQVSPGNGATGVSTWADVWVEFNHELDWHTVNSDTFYLYCDGQEVSGGVTVAGDNWNYAVLNPMTGLEFGKTCTAYLSATITDTSGNQLSNNYYWTFQTLPPPEQPI